MRAAVLAIAIVAAGVSTASADPNLAQATSGFLYFNRPAASLAEHDEELASCLPLARNNYLNSALSRPGPHGPTYSQGIVGDMIASAVNDAMLSGWERAHRNIVIEHCMVVRGWRLMRLDAATGRRLQAMGRDALRAELGPMVAADSPPGEVARAWRNEGGDRNAIFAISPRNANRTLLSALAMDPNTPLPEPPIDVDIARTFSDATLAPVSLAPAPSLGDGQALLIVGLVGPRERSRHYGIDLRHDNSGQVQSARISFADAERVGSDRLRNTQAFIVPTGEWAVAGDSMHMNYCLGAPAFTVNSGDVVFVGEFDRGVQLHPDVSEAAMQRHVPASLLARARAAQWENGASWACPATNLYALEFDGFPFRENYRWGSRAPVD
jgi:hypothetical protein